MKAPMPSAAIGLSSSGILARSAEISGTRFPLLSHHGSTTRFKRSDLLFLILLSFAFFFLVLCTSGARLGLASGLPAVPLFGGLMIFLANHLEINLWFGHLHSQVFHGRSDDLRHRQIAEPFVVRGNDVPRSIFLA